MRSDDLYISHISDLARARCLSLSIFRRCSAYSGSHVRFKVSCVDFANEVVLDLYWTSAAYPSSSLALHSLLGPALISLDMVILLRWWMTK